MSRKKWMSTALTYMCNTDRESISNKKNIFVNVPEWQGLLLPEADCRKSMHVDVKVRPRKMANCLQENYSCLCWEIDTVIKRLELGTWPLKHLLKRNAYFINMSVSLLIPCLFDYICHIVWKEHYTSTTYYKAHLFCVKKVIYFAWL